MKIALLMLTLIGSCGKFEDSVSKLNPLTPISNSMSNINSNSLESSSLSITPGSYYGLLLEEGPNKDIVVHEFQYLSDKSFIIKETRFIAGNLLSGQYHSTKGSYEEENGKIKHTVRLDSCQKLEPFSLVFSGNKSSIIKTTHRSKFLSLYTFASFTPPAPLLKQLGNSVEDIECSKFP